VCRIGDESLLLMRRALQQRKQPVQAAQNRLHLDRCGGKVELAQIGRRTPRNVVFHGLQGQQALRHAEQHGEQSGAPITARFGNTMAARMCLRACSRRRVVCATVMTTSSAASAARSDVARTARPRYTASAKRQLPADGRQGVGQHIRVAHQHAPGGTAHRVEQQVRRIAAQDGLGLFAEVHRLHAVLRLEVGLEVERAVGQGLVLRLVGHLLGNVEVDRRTAAEDQQHQDRQ
jgi:hypothetical protein